MLNGRKRLITALAGFALAATLGIIASSPAQAEPDIDDVEKRVETLFHEAEQASERYNDARLELEQLQKDVTSLEADESRQDARLDDARDDVRDTVIRQYQGQSLSAAGQMLVSDDPEDFLSQMSTMASVGQLQNEVFDDYSTELEALDIRSEATEKRLAQVSELEQQLADEKETIDARQDDAEALLDRLEEEQREKLFAGDATATVPTDVSASGSAQAAVDYAMAQNGKAYVWGAAGPNAFDCSGLTMMAWAQAGVALPHSSAAQYSTGAKVSADDLQPGDLVFYYTPISHVSIYIGDGMIIDAANPGAGVRVAPLYSMPYAGAVRPG